jgi:hypothetical protein
MARRPTLGMRRGNKWRRGQHSECAEATNGAEANTQNARRQQMAQRPTLRMRGGNKWRGGQHSECAEATNGAEANTQNARRQQMARRPTLGMRGGNKWRGGQHSECDDYAAVIVSGHLLLHVFEAVGALHGFERCFDRAHLVDGPSDRFPPWSVGCFRGALLLLRPWTSLYRGTWSLLPNET